MAARLKSFWQTINASYWFYPALFALFALLLASVTIWLDRTGRSAWLSELGWSEQARPEGASNMLTVIAGSTIGVASTVFSITIAAVAYASGNYGPRLLTNFMEDRGNQLSLATFIGTFVFAITTLRTIRIGEEADLLQNGLAPAGDFVPQLSLLTAYLLMAISVAVLVYFLHHIPASIRIGTVLEGIGNRLLREIGETYPDPDRGRIVPEAPEGRAVVAARVGYVQRVDHARLERIAHAAGGHIRLGVRTGDFVHSRIALAFWADDDQRDDLREDEIRACFTLGALRTPAQDLHFLIDELVEIGLRALSPGINDPFTAITAIHWLGAATAELGRRDLARTLKEPLYPGEERLTLRDSDFAHFVTRGFGTMRSAVATSPAAALVMFEALADTAATLRDEVRVKSLRTEGEQLMRQARLALAGPDLERVEARYHSFLEGIGP